MLANVWNTNGVMIMFSILNEEDLNKLVGHLQFRSFHCVMMVEQKFDIYRPQILTWFSHLGPELREAFFQRHFASLRVIDQKEGISSPFPTKAVLLSDSQNHHYLI